MLFDPLVQGSAINRNVIRENWPGFLISPTKTRPQISRIREDEAASV